MFCTFVYCNKEWDDKRCYCGLRYKLFYFGSYWDNHEYPHTNHLKGCLTHWAQLVHCISHKKQVKSDVCEYVDSRQKN